MSKKQIVSIYQKEDCWLYNPALATVLDTNWVTEYAYPPGKKLKEPYRYYKVKFNYDDFGSGYHIFKSNDPDYIISNVGQLKLEL